MGRNAAEEGALVGSPMPTVLAAWTATLLKALVSKGFDGTALARTAGIDVAVFAEQGSRIPLDQTTRLWQLVVEETGDPYFGLRAARHVRPSTFAGLSMGIVTSDTLHDALLRIARHQSVIIDPGGVIEIVERGDRLTWVNRFGVGLVAPCHEAVEAMMGTIVLVARDLLGPGSAPLRVRTARSESADPVPLERFFRCPVELGCDDYQIEFSQVDAKRELPTRSREMALVADRMSREYLAKLDSDDQLSAKVLDMLARLAPHGMPSMSEVAAELALSPRTLQRRLEDEGTTLSQLVETVSIDVASQLLVIDGLTVDATASSMGFHRTRCSTRSALF